MDEQGLLPEQIPTPVCEEGHLRGGLPTIEDRIAQQVAAIVLTSLVDPNFHQDSYGYRPGKSAHQALEVA